LVAEWVPLSGVVLEAAPGEDGARRPYWCYDSAGYRERFQPTTDPEAAAHVMRWLETEAGCAVRVGSDGVCRVTSEGRRIRTSAETRELAICKAALMVMLSLIGGGAANAPPSGTNATWSEACLGTGAAAQPSIPASHRIPSGVVVRN